MISWLTPTMMLPFVVLLIFERHAAHNAVAQRFDDFARFDDRLHVDTFGGAAIVLADDHVLRHVHPGGGVR